MLRHFEESRAVFPAARQKRFGIGVERDLRRNTQRDRAESRLVGSTAFFFARAIMRDRITAARGPLHVSHLIHGR